MIFCVHNFDFCLGMSVFKKFSIYTIFRGIVSLSRSLPLCFNIYRFKNIAKCSHDIWIAKQVLGLASGVFSWGEALFLYYGVMCQTTSKVHRKTLGNLGIISG